MAYINYSPWADAANVGRGLGATLTEILINLPRLRQQMELNRAHSEYYRAGAQSELAQKGLYEAQALTEKDQARYYGSQADYNAARTREINENMAAKENIGIAAGQMPTTVALGGSLGPLISDVFRNIPKLSHNERNALLETFSQGIEFDKPRYRQALGLGQNMLQPVSAEGSLYNAIAGQMEALPTGVKLNYGQRYVNPQTNETLAQGIERAPGATGQLGGVYTTIANAIAEDMAGSPPEEIVSAVEKAIIQLKSSFGQGMPQPQRGTNPPPAEVVRKGPPKVRRNPATGELEVVP